MKETLEAFDKQMAEEPEPTFDIPAEETPSVPKVDEEEVKPPPAELSMEQAETLDGVLEEIRDSAVDEEIPEPVEEAVDDSIEDLEVVGSQVVKSENKKKEKKVKSRDVEQVQLHEDFDRMRAPGESGSAGV